MDRVKIEVWSDEPGQYVSVSRESDTVSVAAVLLSALGHLAYDLNSVELHAVVDAGWGALANPRRDPS